MREIAVTMEALAQHITHRLTTHKSCTAFEWDLAPVFPVKGTEGKKRVEAIMAFAQERGWTATIRDPGIRVTFRKAEA